MSQAELDFSANEFFIWLKSPTTVQLLGLNSVRAIEEFATSKILRCPAQWARWCRRGIPGMDETTTSIAEAMNSSTKTGHLATNPQQDISTSGNTQVKKSNLRAKRMARDNASQLIRTRNWSVSETASWLTTHAEGIASTYFDARCFFVAAKGKLNICAEPFAKCFAKCFALCFAEVLALTSALLGHVQSFGRHLVGLQP